MVDTVGGPRWTHLEKNNSRRGRKKKGRLNGGEEGNGLPKDKGGIHDVGAVRKEKLG